MSRAAERPEFQEIPAGWRTILEEEVRREAFEILHAEAVERGDLPPPPHTWFDRLPGRSLLVLFQLFVGLAVGGGAVILVLQVMRTFRTIV